MAAPPDISTAAAAASLMSGYGWMDSNITYSIAGADSSWPAYEGAGEPASSEYGTLSEVQAQRVRDAMAVWDGLIEIGFTETDDAADPGRIRVAATGTDYWGFAYYPHSHDKGGDIWISSGAIDTTAFAVGTYDWQALLHEIGHAIGLKHPFADSPVLPIALDNYRYSVMSYTGFPEYVLTFSLAPGGDITWVAAWTYMATPGLFDILAAQDRYGVDTLTGAGATTYRFDPADASIQVIQDAGGIDTFDLSAQSRPSAIDLRQGAFSSINIWSGAERIEAEVARFGEDHRTTIAGMLNDPNVYGWRDNVGIAFGTVIENARLGRGHDHATGNDAANMLWGGAGRDTLIGGDGADTLDGGAGDDRLEGGAGDDRYVIASATDKVVEWAGGGTDTIVTWRRAHVLEAEVEVLRAAGAAAVTLVGNSLGNTIFGGALADTVNGVDGDDLLYGLGEADRLYGVAGHDTLLGGIGEDSLFGGVGDDRLWGQAGDDWLVGSAGDDRAIGGDGRDTAYGHDGNDVLSGDAGADLLLGGPGTDTLTGGDGTDTLVGGAGADTLFGGAGADAFRFLVTGEGGDVIRDFDRAQGDVIALATTGFRRGTAAMLVADRNFIAQTDPQPPVREVAFLYDTATGALRYDVDGSGSIAAVLLATLAGAPALSAADIIYA